MLPLKVFVFSLLVAIASCEPTSITAYDLGERSLKIGPKECVQGSSYWCQDLQTAKKCGAFKHCIQAVWEHEKQELDNSSICETCKEMVKQARDELNSNETQELIREVLEGTCHIYFPIKILAEECIKLVDEFVPEFIDMLSSRMDPQTVCKTAWLCNSNKFKQIVEDVKFVEDKLSASDACSDCKVFVTDAVSKVKSMSKVDFEQKLLQGCALLHGYMVEGCRMAISSNIDEIYTYVTTQMDPSQFCALASMCIDGLEPSYQRLPPVNGVYFRKVNVQGPECDFCEQLITRLKEEILANSTKSEVRQLFENICTRLGAYEQKCKDFVNEYFDAIYIFLTEELDSQQVCKALGLCSQSKNARKKPFFAGNDEKNSINYERKKNTIKINDVGKQGVITHTRLPFLKPVNNPKPSDLNCKLNSDASCILCEFVLHKLQDMLIQNQTEEAIKAAIDRVCNVMPKSIAEECTAFIDEYGDALLVILAREIDPSQVCTFWGLCISPSKPELIPIANPPINTMARIVKTDPSNSQLPLERMFPYTLAAPQGVETCLYCQYGMELVHNLLNADGTKQAIVESLDNLCHDLPSKWTDQCDTFVDEYAEAFITALQQENLTEICGVLSLCQGSVAKNMYGSATVAAKQVMKDSNADNCEVCEISVGILAKLLKNPTVDKDVAEALKKVCSLTPTSVQDKCKSILEIYGPYLVKLIGEYVDEKVVCQSIELCPQTPGEVELLGGKKCTYGPSYWCKSKIHARACNAEQHCQEYFGKKN